MSTPTSHRRMAELTDGGRVLVITNDFPPRRGGIESFVLALCRALPPDRVVVYTSRTPESQSFDATLPFPVIRTRAAVLLPTPRVAREAIRIARSHGCDRVLFGAAAPLGLLAPRLNAAGISRVIGLTHGHEVWWAAMPGARRLLRRIGDNVDALTFVSDYCGALIRPALSSSSAARLTRLSPGVDLARFHPALDGSAERARLGVRLDQPVVLAASRLVRRKGHDTLLRAWRKLVETRPDAVLLIVGAGRDRRRLQRYLSKHELDSSVRMVGAVEWDDMPRLYAAANVFALPCRTRRRGLEPEALGVVFLEAAAAGLPVIVGRSGGAPETVLDGETGYVVDPHDCGRLAKLILTLLEDDQRARSMGSRGRQFVAEQYSEKRCSDGFLHLMAVSSRHGSSDDVKHADCG
ncbi:MAG: glycosyltransferase family 4 protein [Nocardioidaceae bacterium]